MSEQAQIEELQAELSQWKSEPMTQRFFEYLWAVRMITCATDWPMGCFTGNNLDEMALKNAKGLGTVEAIDNILTLDAQDILNKEREYADAEQFRRPARSVERVSQNG